MAVFSCFTAIGALTGGILLLTLPSSVFDAVVPVLILLSCALMALKGRLTPTEAHRGKGHMVAAAAGVFLTGIYGGYFGAAQGIILLSLLSLLIPDDLQRLNALKNVLARWPTASRRCCSCGRRTSPGRPRRRSPSARSSARSSARPSGAGCRSSGCGGSSWSAGRSWPPS